MGTAYTLPVNRERRWVEPAPGWAILCDYDLRAGYSTHYRSIDLPATLSVLQANGIQVVDAAEPDLDSSLLVREDDLVAATLLIVDAPLFEEDEEDEI